VILVRIFGFLSKTLTTLNLGDNDIGDEGATVLANAFRENKVSIFFGFVFRVAIFSFLS
jgi:Ran GTPase-activating protein (RanGAP) involved in mRNA processing and transport